MLPPQTYVPFDDTNREHLNNIIHTRWRKHRPIMIITLIILGRLLEARAKAGTGEAIRRLLGLQARTARVVRARLPRSGGTVAACRSRASDVRP